MRVFCSLGAVGTVGQEGEEHFVLSLMLGGVGVNCVYRTGQLWG